MQSSIPFNPPLTIGICFGDSTRATCIRTAAEFQRLACKMRTVGWGGGGGRESEERGGDRSITPFDRSRNSSTTQFALSRITSPGFLVAILRARYTYSPQYGSSRTTHLACLPRNRFSIFSRRILHLLPHFRKKPEKPRMRNSKLF